MCADVVFLSPPWGGPKYTTKPNYSLDAILPPTGGQELYDIASNISENIAFFLPRNTNVDEVNIIWLNFVWYFRFGNLVIVIISNLVIVLEIHFLFSWLINCLNDWKMFCLVDNKQVDIVVKVLTNLHSAPAAHSYVMH